MSTPTKGEIINAYDALETLAATSRHEDKITRGLKHLVRLALPPLPRPTMADVEWDNDVHYLAEAEHVDWGTMIMLKPMRAYPQIKCLSTEGGEQNCVYALPADLTPTGRRYTLTEVQDD